MDAVLIGLGIVPIVILNYVAKPFQRGFYCNDESIRYPLKENTISSLLLYVVGAAIVAVVVRLAWLPISLNEDSFFR